jgi:hypothetical protein
MALHFSFTSILKEWIPEEEAHKRKCCIDIRKVTDVKETKLCRKKGQCYFKQNLLPYYKNMTNEWATL